MSYKELSTQDKDGNTWKLSLTVDKSKTNRYKFSFFLNDKEFNLSKLQSKVLADMTWELVERVLKDKHPNFSAQGNFSVGPLYAQKEGSQEMTKEPPKKPSKRIKQDEVTEDSKKTDRPKKRAKK